jgi:type IV pilus assembly protein PilV
MIKSIRAQRGFSLIEVLVTLVVLSLGILGLAGLQSVALKNSHSAMLRAQAAQYAYDMLDRMRVNRAAAIGGAYNLTMEAAAPGGTNLPDQDRAGWLAQVATLPSGDGAITVNAAGVATVTVQWSEATLGGGTVDFSVTSEL